MIETLILEFKYLDWLMKYTRSAGQWELHRLNVLHPAIRTSIPLPVTATPFASMQFTSFELAHLYSQFFQQHNSTATEISTKTKKTREKNSKCFANQKKKVLFDIKIENTNILSPNCNRDDTLRII